jgi:DNA-binding beta-propeller fold protein YncE
MRAMNKSSGATKCTAFLLSVAAVLVLLLLTGARAEAAPPPLLSATPEDGAAGSAAGRLVRPLGIAANPVNRDLYVTDAVNSRIDVFSAWGNFVEAFGWGVASGAAESQVCTSVCQAGVAGSGAGQLSGPAGIVSDAAGNLYVIDVGNLRVDKFSPSGAFILAFGYQVNKTTHADVCTAADVAGGDECGPGQEGSEIGQFSKWPFYSEGRTIAVGPSGDIYVGDDGRIQVFDPDGSFVEAINFSEVPGLPDVAPGSLAVAPDGTAYLSFFNASGNEGLPDVYEVDPATRKLLGRIGVAAPRTLKTDEEGNLYVVSYLEHTEKEGVERDEVLIFDSSGVCTTGCPGDKFAATEPFFEARISSVAAGDSCGPTDVYVGIESPLFGEEISQLKIYGSPPDPAVCPPPVVPPSITDQFSTDVGSETATIKATINPHFWPDTTYFVQYGTEPCATGTCNARSPISLGGQVVNAPVTTAGVVLSDLQPGTTYHYRFVSQSSGGGPVFGPDRTFTTYPSTSRPGDGCPNASFRTGFGGELPDCRAFEMVSPLDKEGGDIVGLRNVFGYPAILDQSDLTGQKMTYSAARNFGGVQSGAYSAQYMATRTTNGWSTTAISPPRNAPIYERGLATDTEYEAFSPDLCETWLRHDSDPPLAEGAPAGYANLYSRDYCPEGAYHALRTEAPTKQTGAEYQPQVQGFAAHGGVSIFAANESLTADAPPVSVGQLELYESRLGQEPSYVCVLPNGKPVTGGCSAGTNNKFGGGSGHGANLQGAISEDGSRIFWSEAPNEEGKIFLRSGGIETLPVSAFAESKSGTSASEFWAASAQGSRAIFTTGSIEGSSEKALASLWEYDVESGVSTKIAGRVAGLMGVSRDAGHVYFVSEEALGGAAVAGKANLYLSVLVGEEHRIRFVGQISAADADAATQGLNPSPVNVEPTKHVAQVTPDGEVLAFMSTGSPTGFDNKDANSGKPDAEVYVYDARNGSLHCVSCNRTGARPEGKVLEPKGEPTGPSAAAELPPWETSLYDPRELSTDGNRLFFESYDPLVPADTNHQLDLYEWEMPGTGGCREGEGSWLPAAGGCVDMISSGQSSYPSEFVDATPDGSNVFFSTLSSLVLQDPGQLDIYDARVEGGFPPPPAPPAECEGSACQSPGAAPAPVTPSSQNFQGPAKAPANAKKCAKNKHLVKKGGKQQCVAKKKHHKKGHKKAAAKKKNHKAKRTGKTGGAGR